MPASPDPNLEAEAILRHVFGSNLRIYRQAHGLSQLEFAHQLGVSPSYLGGIERGERNLQFSTVGRIADLLGEHPLDLLTAAPPELNDEDE